MSGSAALAAALAEYQGGMALSALRGAGVRRSGAQVSAWGRRDVGLPVWGSDYLPAS